MTGKKNTKVVSNLPDSIEEWKTKFFFAKLKELCEVIPKWGFSTEWRDKVANILDASSPQKG
ncbi:hypothetical protein ACLOJK_035992 [Asimina triloba]